MNKVSLGDIKKLRDETGAGMMDCRRALEEASGDFQTAIDNLRKRGQKLSAKRADRDAKEGVVIALTSHNRNNGVVLRLSCETDFVAKNDSFIELTKTFADIALKNLPDTLEDLLALPFDNKISVADKVTEQVAVIGEKIELSNYAKIETKAGEGQVIPYIHTGNRAGVIVALNQEGPKLQEAGKDVAMQVVAMKPIAIDKDGVDKTVVEREIEIGKEQARLENKPEAIIEKIALGKLSKFYKEKTLLNQEFVKDSKKSVADFLESVNSGLTVTDFKHITLG